MALKQEVIEPAGQVDACVIWLHGLGASGHDFVPVVPHLEQCRGLNIRFIFPHAPAIAVTCNNGVVMPAWYDIIAMTEERQLNLEHLKTSVGYVRGIIEGQIAAGIAPERIVLIGFSQGGAVSYHTALTLPQRLGGLMALSTYLPAPDSVSAQLDPHRHQLPVVVCHGRFDVMVSDQGAIKAENWLREHDFNVISHRYNMGHEICAEEIADIDASLARWLG